MNTPHFSPESPDEYNITELTSFFWRQLQWISSMYTDEDREKFLSWHTQEQFSQKINDPKRFFRIIRDKKWTIIAYFESKQSSEEDTEDMQVIQWFFVKDEYRNKWALKSMWNEFIEWCRKNNYTIVWSYTSLQNEVSKAVHRKLMDIIPVQAKIGNTDFLKYGKFLSPINEEDWL